MNTRFTFTFLSRNHSFNRTASFARTRRLWLVSTRTLQTAAVNKIIVSYLETSVQHCSSVCDVITHDKVLLRYGLLGYCTVVAHFPNSIKTNATTTSVKSLLGMRIYRNWIGTCFHLCLLFIAWWAKNLLHNLISSYRCFFFFLHISVFRSRTININAFLVKFIS